MKVIDILNKMAKGEEIDPFYTTDDRYRYYTRDGRLYQQKFDIYETEIEVDWYIYQEWLNEEITFKDIEECPKIND